VLFKANPPEEAIKLRPLSAKTVKNLLTLSFGVGLTEAEVPVGLADMIELLEML
jgi:hypothetical protein